jgi:TP901-1 family phage major tail protein
MAISKASLGDFKCNTSGSSDTAVAQLVSMSLNRSQETIDTSVLDTTSRTYETGTQTSTIDLELLWDPSSEGQSSLSDSITSSEKIDFEIYPNNTTGIDYYSGTGIVTSYSISNASDAMVTASVSIQVDGTLTEAQVS